MKKNLIKWLMPFILFAAGCSDDTEKIRQGVNVEITETEVIIPASGNISANTIISSTADWTISGESNWCTYSPSKGVAGETIFLEFKANEVNEDYSKKTMLLTLTAAGVEHYITVTQKQKDAILFSKDKLEVSTDGDYVQLLIGANVDYSITIPDQFKSWVERSNPPARSRSTRALDTLKTNWFYVHPNPDYAEASGDGRTAFLLVNGPARYVDTAWIFQYDKDRLMLNRRKVNVPYDKETTLRIELRASVPWNAAAQETWITLSEIANRSDAIDVKVASSGGTPRSGKVIFKATDGSGLTDTLTIEQKKLLFVQFPTTKYDAAAAGEALTVTVEHNTADSFYLLIPKVEAKWISIAGQEAPLSDGSVKVPYTLGVSVGAGVSTFTFTVAQNPPSDIKREGNIVVRTVETDQQETVYDTATIIQAGRPLHPELAVLDSIYKKWNGGNNSVWNGKEGWATGKSLDRAGVRTALRGNEPQQPHIVSLNLGFVPPTAGGAYAAPTIPEEIGDLEYLEELYIGELRIESDLGLVSLQSLPAGAVPASLGKLKRLKTLRIAGRGLTTVPEELGALKMLETLELAVTTKDSDMAWIGNLTNLNRLLLVNRYNGPMPESFGNLINLTYLKIGGDNNWYPTAYTTIPSSFGNLTNLRHLEFASAATTLPPSVGNFTELETFYSRTADTTTKGLKTLPDEIAYWAKLVTFQVKNNDLTKMPNISGMENLETLEISNAPNMGGSLPSMDKLAKVTNMNISRTKLTGEIPAGICNNTEMTSLNLSYNRLIGPIPERIGNLKNLTTFNLRGNRAQENYTGLSGTIPTTIGALTKLTTLYLDSNRLTGNIPREINGMESLTTLYLNNNNLSGTISDAIFSMVKLDDIYLQNNEFTAIPGEIQNISTESAVGSKIINLDNNKITNFPPEIGKIRGKIFRLYLRNNNIEGILPIDLTLGFLASTSSFLDLRGNRLQGDMPQEIRRVLGALKEGRWESYPNCYFNPQQTGYGFNDLPNQ